LRWGARSGLHYLHIVLGARGKAIGLLAGDAPFNPLASLNQTFACNTSGLGAKTDNPTTPWSSLTDVESRNRPGFDSFSDSVLSGELTYYFEDAGLPLWELRSPATDSWR